MKTPGKTSGLGNQPGAIYLILAQQKFLGCGHKSISKDRSNLTSEFCWCNFALIAG